jgi:MSHA biogenesis protein MshO
MKIRTRAQGFTLVEAIVVIVIIGIVAGMVAVFIRVPILGYRDTVDRAELTDQADLALRRMARDIRLAVPNSIRVMSAGDGASQRSALEFLPTKTGGRYLSVDDGLQPDPSLSSLDDPALPLAFTVIAPPATFDRVVAGDRLVVYNLGQGTQQSDAYSGGNTALIRSVSAAADNGQLGPVRTVTLDRNPFTGQSPLMTSPTSSFQVTGGAVSFVCAPDGNGSFTLSRVWNYGINATQTIPAGGSSALMAMRLDTCAGIFSYGSAATLRTGLVLLSLGLKGRSPDTPTVRLVHQVHIDNMP